MATLQVFEVSTIRASPALTHFFRELILPLILSLTPLPFSHKTNNLIETQRGVALEKMRVTKSLPFFLLKLKIRGKTLKTQSTRPKLIPNWLLRKFCKAISPSQIYNHAISKAYILKSVYRNFYSYSYSGTKDNNNRNTQEKKLKIMPLVNSQITIMPLKPNPPEPKIIPN